MAEILSPYAVISVIEPVLQQPAENIPAFVTYLVGGTDPHGEFNIRRRYREFLSLRNKLVQRFIGIYIPPIPSKRTSNNTQERYVEQRRRFLHYFCQKIAQRPFIFDSDIFQTFIRGDPDFERAAQKISTQQYALITNVYEIQFKKRTDQSDLAKVLLDLEQQQEILKSVSKKLSAIREEILVIGQAKNQFVRDFGYCFKTILPKYEKEFISKHDPTGKSELLSTSEHFKANLDQYLHFSEDNLLQDYGQLLNYDIRQTRALLKMDNIKLDYESERRSRKEELEKLKSGRTTIKSLFTSGNKEAQIKELETVIPQFERNEQLLATCLPLSAVAIHEDIIRYKKSRSVDYLSKLQLLARKSIRLIDFYGRLLNSPFEGSQLESEQ